MDLEQESDINERSALSLLNAKKQGYLIKEGGKVKKNWKKRWFILHQEYLYYFVDDGAKRPKGVIKLADYSNCEITNEVPGRFGFRICPKEDGCIGKTKKDRRIYLIVTPKMSERDEWVNAISETIDELKNVKGKYSFGQKRIERTCFIKVVEAKLSDKTEKDTYCTILADNLQKVRTPPSWKSTVFDQEYEFDLSMNYHHICVQLRDAKKKKDNIIGQAFISSDELRDQKVHENWYKMFPYNHTMDVKGELELAYSRKDKEITITVFAARDLLPMNEGLTTDPFITVQYGPKETRTPVIRKTLDPKWTSGNSFTFDIIDDATPIIIEAFHDNRDDTKDTLGEVVLTLGDISVSNGTQRWLGLQAKGRNGDDTVGDMRLILHVQDAAILPDRVYDELVLLLLQKDMSIIKQLAKVSNKKEKPVAECLVKAFEMRRSAVHYIKEITKAEIEATASPTVIFRSNTVCTKSVDMYMRLVGMPYLHHIMKSIINVIFTNSRDRKKSCELDPFRIKEEKEEKKTKIISKNLQTLLGYVQMIFEAIRGSVAFCPANFRNIFEHIRKEVLMHFPAHPVSAYTATAGFIFLRFFCPSLLSPKSFGLTSEHPSPQLARDLTLIAKCLQNLANLVEFGKKEPFMIPCNKYINDNLDAMKQFLDNICCPPDTAVDELPIKNQINWGREMARVHYHLVDSLELMREKSALDEDLQKLQVILDKLDDAVRTELKHENNPTNVPKTPPIPRTELVGKGFFTTSLPSMPVSWQSPQTENGDHERSHKITHGTHKAPRVKLGSSAGTWNGNSSNPNLSRRVRGKLPNMTSDHENTTTASPSSPSSNDSSPVLTAPDTHDATDSALSDQADFPPVASKTGWERNTPTNAGRCWPDITLSQHGDSFQPKPVARQNATVGGLSMVCSKCGFGFARNETFVKALNKCWHSKCFTCSNCSRAISSFVNNGGMPMCLECQPVIKCKNCEQRIDDSKFINFGAHAFHEKCFTCSECYRKIGLEENYVIHENGVYLCAGCNRRMSLT